MTATKLKAFLVEDDAIIRMMVADMLQDNLGHSIAAEAGHLEEAMALGQSTEFDFALLDMNIHGEMVFPVAQLLQARGLPFIFATGYVEGVAPDEFRDRPLLRKPFTVEALSAAIDEVRAVG